MRWLLSAVGRLDCSAAHSATVSPVRSSCCRGLAARCLMAARRRPLHPPMPPRGGPLPPRPQLEPALAQGRRPTERGAPTGCSSPGWAVPFLAVHWPDKGGGGGGGGSLASAASCLSHGCRPQRNNGLRTWGRPAPSLKSWRNCRPGWRPTSTRMPLLQERLSTESEDLQETEAELRRERRRNDTLEAQLAVQNAAGPAAPAAVAARHDAVDVEGLAANAADELRAQLADPPARQCRGRIWGHYPSTCATCLVWALPRTA